ARGRFPGGYRIAAFPGLVIAAIHLVPAGAIIVEGAGEDDDPYDPLLSLLQETGMDGGGAQIGVVGIDTGTPDRAGLAAGDIEQEIGRASCRERMEISVDGVRSYQGDNEIPG